MSGADPAAVARALAHALDRDAFDEARALLAPGCVYDLGDVTLHGPDAIVASYAGNSAWAHGHLDRIEYASGIERVAGREVTIRYLDRLEHAGRRFEHRCRQVVTVDDDGRVTAIRHEDLPGEPERLAAWFDEVGITRDDGRDAAADQPPR